MANLYGRGTTPNRTRDFGGRPGIHTTLPRWSTGLSNNVSIGSSGTVRLVYFQAHRHQTATALAVQTGVTNAAATPTLCRMGLYVADDDGNLELVGACANDTTLFATAQVRYERDMEDEVRILPGLWYAFAILVVSEATMPNFYGSLTNGASTTGLNWTLAPRLVGQLASQSDLPESIDNGDISDASTAYFGEVL